MIDVEICRAVVSEAQVIFALIGVGSGFLLGLLFASQK